MSKNTTPQNPTLRFFSHNGFVGAISDLKNGTFINDINNARQLGVVVAIEHVAMPSEVKEIIRKNYMREGGSFAQTMITRGIRPNIAVFGKEFHMLSTEDGKYIISRDCDLSLLDEVPETDNVPDPDFVLYIENGQNE